MPPLLRPPCTSESVGGWAASTGEPPAAISQSESDLRTLSLLRASEAYFGFRAEHELFPLVLVAAEERSRFPLYLKVERSRRPFCNPKWCKAKKQPPLTHTGTFLSIPRPRIRRTRDVFDPLTVTEMLNSVRVLRPLEHPYEVSALLSVSGTFGTSC